ncbi:MAG: hypothetical protein H0V20_03395, partial [Actinobacteria bacterium]|nr:hypothetical protein [Actinomycetota bacterium]
RGQGARADEIAADARNPRADAVGDNAAEERSEGERNGREEGRDLGSSRFPS